MPKEITSQELLRLIDDSGLELQTKPGHLTGPAVQQLVATLNRKFEMDDSEE